MRKGIVANQWNYTPREWLPNVSSTRSEVVRVQVDWRHLDMRYLERVVRGVRRRGAEPIIMVGGGNREPILRPSVRGYALAVRRIARRFRGRHRGIEIWNEPNDGRFWEGVDDDLEGYARLMRRAYRAVNRVAPRARVILAAPAATADAYLWTRAVLRRAPADAVAVHPYGAAVEDTMRQLYLVRGITSLPLVVTEFGWGSGSTCSGPRCLTEEAQAVATVRVLNRLRGTGYVTDALYYEDRDAPPGRCVIWHCKAGLFYADGSRKLALEAFRRWR